MTTGTTVHACWRWFTAHCHLMSSLGPLDDGPPSLANQPVQPPVQPVQPWAKSLVCHVLACDMICSRDVVYVCSYLDFGVAEDLSDFSCIACGIYKMRCCNPTATTYQMRSLEPCIADGFAPVEKAIHVSLRWSIHENPNSSRAHPALGLPMWNLLLWVWHIMAYLVLETLFKCLEVPIHPIKSGNYIMRTFINS